MKKKYGFFVLLSISLGIMAQDMTISGQVTDKESGEALVGATVRHEATGKEVITDFDGNFIISDVKAGKNEIKVSYISYTTLTLSDIILEEGKKSSLTVELKQMNKAFSSQSFMASLEAEEKGS